ncbi:MAG: hypothetical protein HY042_06535 [Spirochaetia bacterium]|nr:hypothetical protein [Spirochaetia bacterium]
MNFMRKFLSRLSWIALLSLATLAIFLSFLPLLWPVVLVTAGIVIVTAAVFLVRHAEAGQEGEYRGLRRWFQILVSTPHVDGADIERGERSARRALRLGVTALVINVLLYSVLLLHSWACMIRPLSRELEPVRRAFREAGKLPSAGDQP